MLACPRLRVNSGDGQSGTFQDETMKKGEVPLGQRWKGEEELRVGVSLRDNAV
jgi:hypothetical protein